MLIQLSKRFWPSSSLPKRFNDARRQVKIVFIIREAEAIAKYNGEDSKARRCARGIKTLIDLEKRIKSGHPVRDDDIPPQGCAFKN